MSTPIRRKTLGVRRTFTTGSTTLQANTRAAAAATTLSESTNANALSEPINSKEAIIDLPRSSASSTSSSSFSKEIVVANPSRTTASNRAKTPLKVVKITKPRAEETSIKTNPKPSSTLRQSTQSRKSISSSSKAVVKQTVAPKSIKTNGHHIKDSQEEISAFDTSPSVSPSSTHSIPDIAEDSSSASIRKRRRSVRSTRAPSSAADKEADSQQKKSLTSSNGVDSETKIIDLVVESDIPQKKRKQSNSISEVNEKRKRPSRTRKVDKEGPTFRAAISSEVMPSQRSLRAKKVVSYRDAAEEPLSLCEPSWYPSKLSQPLSLVTCHCALAMMDIHSHCLHCEVIGLLAGTWDENTKTLVIVDAYPCKTVETNDDMVNVEMDSVSQVETAILIAERGLSVVGWYHSHPYFLNIPSLVDVENQMKYQQLFTDDKENSRPFVAAIITPYGKNMFRPAQSSIKWYITESRTKSTKKSNGKSRFSLDDDDDDDDDDEDIALTQQPMELWYEISEDNKYISNPAALTETIEDMMQRAAIVVKESIDANHRVDFQSTWTASYEKDSSDISNNQVFIQDMRGKFSQKNECKHENGHGKSQLNDSNRRVSRSSSSSSMGTTRSSSGSGLLPLTAQEKRMLEKSTFDIITTRLEKFLYSVYRYLPSCVPAKKKERWMQILKQSIQS